MIRHRESAADTMTTTANSSTPSPAAALLERLLAECVRRDASDLHLAPGLAPYFRIHGPLEPATDLEVVSPEQTANLAGELTRQQMPTVESGSIDGAITARDGTRFRFNVFRRQGEIAVALRRLEDRFRSLADLGLPDSLYSLCDLPDGLVLVCGPTGAGKSTTLATLIDRINQQRRCHIVTIEDPIEYIHTPAKALVNQRQVGSDVGGFNAALVASLRQDPDVILVGEIRDLDTVRTAITAAETGHLVFTTVHAGDCVGAIERLAAVFPADEQTGVRRQLALVLKTVIAQHLVVADGPATSARGPSEGRRMRVVTSEVLTVTSAVGNLIATAKSNQIYSAIETGTGQGMQTLEQDLARLMVAGLLSEATATALARNPSSMRDRAAMLRKPAPRAVGAR
jgi:twitching motility protein PilT